MTTTAPPLTRTVNMPAIGMTVAAVVALALALRVPLTVTVLGFVLFGALHNVLELRYVLGRFANVLTGRLLGVLVALITGIAVCRLIPTRTGEILLGYAVLAAATVWALRGRWMAFGATMSVLAMATAASLIWPVHHFVVFTHLHNIVPLVFLWEWTRSTATRAVTVGWVLLIPAALLLGFADALLRTDGPAVLSPAATSLLEGTMATRFLAVFAFLQTMHYVVWVWLLPRYATEASAGVPALKGWRAWGLGAAAAVALGVILATDYASGRGVLRFTGHLSCLSRVSSAVGTALQSPERTVVNLSDVAPQPDPPVDTIVVAVLVLIAVAAAAFLYLKLRKKP